MAVGVPENEVFAAADAVLARGERPTVERVRLELGRGSPARVGGLLDQWWARLAERLSGETRLPALPAQVSQAFVVVWQQAAQMAQGIAEQGLSEQRQVLATERERLASLEDQGRRAAAQARQQVADALAGRQAAETRLADLDLLLDQRLAQIADLRQQREDLLRERVAEQQQAQLVLQQLRELTLKTDQERSAHETYLRGVEDRAHREVDRAREESRATTAQVKQLGKHTEALEQRLAAALVQVSEAGRQAATHQAVAQQSAQLVQDMQGQLLTLQDALNEALQHGAAQGARAETLEQYIRQLQGLLKPEPKKGVRKPVPAQRNVRPE